MSSLKILVAFGGVSPEHEVSVLTAMQLTAVLQEMNHTVVPLYIAKNGIWYTGEALTQLENYKDLKSLIASCKVCAFQFDDMGRAVLAESGGGGLFRRPNLYSFDLAIPSFHGSEGENGSFQGLLEVFNIPYAGSGVTASSIGMDKYLAKSVCRAHEIPVVDDVCFSEADWTDIKSDILKQITALGFPVFVKPVTLGSSIGVTRVNTSDKLAASIEEAFRYDVRLLAEKGVHPLTEINCSVLGSAQDATASVLEQPRGSEELLSFADKYQRGESGKGMASADRIIPAPLDAETTNRIRSLSVRIFQLLNCSGVARLDFLMNSDTGEIFFNEINTIPGSFSFYLWDHENVNFRELVSRLIAVARQRHQQKNGRVRSYETNLLSEKAVRGIKGLKGKGR